MYSPTLPLTDPPAQSPIVDGVGWVQGAALGSVATTVAVLAVATIGLLMLSGRLDLRRGITVVIGCFLLFGAGTIGAAITGLTGADVTPRTPNASAPSQLPGAAHAPALPDTSYDPYAGASVPVRR